MVLPQLQELISENYHPIWGENYDKAGMSTGPSENYDQMRPLDIVQVDIIQWSG